MSPAPNGRKPAVFDLDASRAARREANKENFAFRFGGEDFAIVPMDEWPVDLMDVLQTGDLKKALHDVIVGGEEALDRFLAFTPTLGDFEALFNAAAEWAGVESLPNSLPLPRPVTTPT